MSIRFGHGVISALDKSISVLGMKQNGFREKGRRVYSALVRVFVIDRSRGAITGRQRKAKADFCLSCFVSLLACLRCGKTGNDFRGYH